MIRRTLISGRDARLPFFLQLLPYLVALGTFGGALALWRSTVTASRLDAQHAFEHGGEFILDRIDRQLESDERVLRSARIAFREGSDLPLEEWRKYVDIAREGMALTTLSSVAYAPWVLQEHKASVVARARAQGLNGFDIQPNGERPAYVPLLYAEVFDAAQQPMLGFDLLGESACRDAMLRAIETGQSQLSPILTLGVDPTRRDAMFLFVPVFRRGTSANSPEDRRTALQGFICGAIRIEDLVRKSVGGLPPDLDVMVAAEGGRGIVFDSRVGQPPPRKPAKGPEHRFDLSLQAFGQNLEFAFIGTPRFGPSADLLQSSQILELGMAISAIITLGAFMLRSARRRELALANAKADRLIGVLAEGVVVQTATGKIVECNDAAVRILGRRKTDVIGGTLAELTRAALHPDGSLFTDDDHPSSLTLRTARSVRGVEMSIENGQGQVWMLVNSEPVVDARGALRHVVTSFTDISAQKRAERSRADEAERRRVQFEQLPDGVVVIDLESKRFIEFNSAAHWQLGYTWEEFAQLSVSDVEARQDDEAITQRIAKVQATGRSDFETRHRTRTGELRTVSVTAQLVTHEGARVIQATWRDITEARRAADELRDAHRRLKRIGDNLPSGYVFQIVWRPKAKMRFTYVSAGVKNVHGINVDTATADPEVLLSQIEREHRLRFLTIASRAAQDLSRVEIDLRIQSANGTWKWVQYVAAPTRLDDQSIVWDGIGIDITERKEAEEDRLVLSKLESTGIMAGGIAHDFNNLLASILLGLDVAQAPNSTSADVRSCLELARQSTLAARGLTKLLITFSRGGEPVLEVVDLGALLRESVTLAVSGSKAVADVAVVPDLWAVEVDEGQIAQVVRNIVLNAREALPNGGTIRVRAENVELPPSADQAGLSAGKYIRIAVTDEGTGIAPEHLPRIFDPYFSTKSRGEQKGMGLGLTICHAIITRHQGAIEVTSVVGRGTTAWVFLPASRKPLLEHPKVVSASVGSEPGTVLVMDDEPAVRMLVARAAEKLGCTVLQAQNGQEALDRFRAERDARRTIHLVLLDLTVRGGFGGVETLQRIRQLDPRVRAVVMSGYSNDKTLQDYALYGFQDVLRKPFDVAELAAVMSRVIPLSRTGPETTLSGPS